MSAAIHLGVGLILVGLFVLGRSQKKPNLDVSVQEISHPQTSSIPKKTPKGVEPARSTVESVESGNPKTAENPGKDADVPAMSSYLEAVRQQILSHQHYPMIARKKGLQGIVEVRVFLNDQGGVLKKELISPGKMPILEDAALVAIDESLPFPRPPVKISGAIVVPIEFRLR